MRIILLRFCFTKITSKEDYEPNKDGPSKRTLLNKNSNNIIMKYIPMPSILNHIVGFNK